MTEQDTKAAGALDDQPATQIVKLEPENEAALAAVLTAELAEDDETAEQFRRYTAACNGGLIDQIFDACHKHGQPEGYSEKGAAPIQVVRWPVTRQGLNLSVYAFPTGGLVVMRNDDCVLDDRAGADLLFDAGQGLWLKALMLEHTRLEREAAQQQRLAERQALREREQKRNRAI